MRLADSDLMLANPSDNVLHYKVVDRDGEQVGVVNAIMVDPDQRRARFLEVESGGFLGIGGDKRLIPIDAVISVDDAVHVECRRETVMASAGFDPELVPEETYYRSIYEHFGYIPYWTEGYVYPGYPWR